MKTYILLTFLGFFLYSAPLRAQTDSDQKKIILTTMDLKQEYEVIEVIFGCKTVASYTSIVQDDIQSAWDRLEIIARSRDVDAVIGIKIEIGNSGERGGIVTVYGTGVKFKK